MTQIWHNPRCTKSGLTVKLIAEHTPEVRLYLQDPPSADEIAEVLVKLGMTAAQMIRKGEDIYKELGLKDADEAALIAAMVAHPILIERPIVIVGDRAAIGRPPEDVLPLFG